MRLRWGALVMAAVLGALGSLTRTARAAGITLDWDAPPGCPTQATALSAVTRLAGTGTPRELSASVRIRRAGGGWVAEVTAAGGARELHGTTCLEVAQSAAVILALAAGGEPLGAAAKPDESQAVAAQPVTRRANETGAPAAASAAEPASPPRAAEAADETQSPWQGGAALHLLGEAGILPAPSIGAIAAARLSRGAFGTELRVLALLPRSETLPTDASRGGEFGWQSLGLAGTYTFSERWSCWAGFEVGRLTGEGFGVDHHVVGKGTWLAPMAGVMARLLTTKHWALEAAGGAAVPVTRPSFELDEHGAVHRPGALSGRLELGIGWR